MTRITTNTLLTLTLLAFGLTPSASAQMGAFEWIGHVAEGHGIEIRGVKGSIRAVPSDDDSVRVRATRMARQSDPAEVSLEIVEHADGVTICAVYPGSPSLFRTSECRPRRPRNSDARVNLSGNHARGNDTQVDFVVHVPAGVRLKADVTTGSIVADGLRSDVTAETVNGGVQIETTGRAEAFTTNGNISARFDPGETRHGLRFSTVNGSITLSTPAGLNADLRASTTNGSIRSDFPVAAKPRLMRIPWRRSLNGTIGEGGQTLRVSTVNGSIRLAGS